MRAVGIDDKEKNGIWNDHPDIRDAIKEWLNKPNSELAPLTNAEALVAQWNLNNPDHKLPKH
ncbi:MAG: hypothetical protein NC217_04530 [Muribaculaceae bacterium]|nr:hypothetical protein [Muribaculaceae bacterium]